METTRDYRLTLTEEEESIKEKVLTLLNSFESEPASRMTTYFVEVDEDGDQIEEMGTEYDVCDDDTCIKNMAETLSSEYPDKLIDNVFTHNNGDHESIERCNQCGKPLNEFMTWISMELDHYLQNRPTFESLNKYPSEVFDLIAIFQSFPSIDEEMGQYQLHQKMLGNTEPFESKIKRQREFKESVIGLMKHVINEIESNQ